MLALSSSACVELDQNDDLTTALEQQNEILQEQNNLLAEQLENANDQHSVVLAGTVYQNDKETMVSEGKVKYKLGHTWSDSFDIKDGKFTLEGLPARSDISLELSSDDGSFLTKTVHGTTMYTAGGKSYMDIDNIITGTEESVVLVVKNEDGANVKDIEFSASYYNNAEFNQTTLDIVNITYDEDKSGYEFKVPKYAVNDVKVVMHLDTNEDGEPNYNAIEFGPTPYHNIVFELDRFEDDIRVIKLEQLTPPETIAHELTAKIALVDNNLDVIEGASILIMPDDYSDEEPKTAMYNAETKTYDIDFIQGTSKQTIYLSAGEVGENVYVAGKLEIDLNGTDKLNVKYKDLEEYHYKHSYLINLPESGQLDLVMKPTVTPKDGVVDVEDVELLYSKTSIQDQAFDFFFSQPVAIDTDGVKLYQEDVLSFTKGSDDNEDFVFSGTTLISQANKEIEYEVASSFNNTYQVITPKTKLTGTVELMLDLDSVTNIETDTANRINSTFTIDAIVGSDETTAFDINDIRLDNNNFLDEGAVIVAENTAGEVHTPYNNDEYVYLYFPSSVNSLKNLTIQRTSRVERGYEYTSVGTRYRLINNGQKHHLSRHYLYSVAQNEHIEYSGTYSSNFHFGTSLDDGYYYDLRVEYFRLGDNIDAEANSITFDYAYETFSGEFHSGSITLPVH